MNLKVGDKIQMLKNYGSVNTYDILTVTQISSSGFYAERQDKMAVYLLSYDEGTWWAILNPNGKLSQSQVVNNAIGALNSIPSTGLSMWIDDIAGANIFEKPDNIKVKDNGFIGSHNLPVDLDWDDYER